MTRNALIALGRHRVGTHPSTPNDYFIRHVLVVCKKSGTEPVAVVGVDVVNGETSPPMLVALEPDEPAIAELKSEGEPVGAWLDRAMRASLKYGLMSELPAVVDIWCHRCRAQHRVTAAKLRQAQVQGANTGRKVRLIRV